MALCPCTGFTPAMPAMQRSYKMLKQEGPDLGACEGRQIKNFFKQVGLKGSFDFDSMIVDTVKGESPTKYESTASSDLC
jgi:hypothetical protein